MNIITVLFINRVASVKSFLIRIFRVWYKAIIFCFVAIGLDRTLESQPDYDWQYIENETDRADDMLFTSINTKDKILNNKDYIGLQVKSCHLHFRKQA